MNKLLLIILDGVPYDNWRRLFGNLEGWVQAGEAQVWRMRSVLPSISATCYASIHTGIVISGPGRNKPQKFYAKRRSSFSNRSGVGWRSEVYGAQQKAKLNYKYLIHLVKKLPLLLMKQEQLEHITSNGMQVI